MVRQALVGICGPPVRTKFVVEETNVFWGKEVSMPKISHFFGIDILMYYNDHSPAHFHAKYGSDEVLVDIRNLSLMEGKLSRRAINLVLDWAELHQRELEENWENCRNKEAPKKIAPLK